MKKLYKIFILFLFPLGILAQNPLSIKILNPPKKIKPGGYFTIFLSVKGIKPFENTLDAQLMLPEDWSEMMTKKPSKIIGEQTVKFIYTIAVPNQTPKGIYNIGIRVFGDGYEDEIENQSVEVEQVRKLEIVAINTPEFVNEGDTIRTEYIVQNLGNNTEKLGLKSLIGKVELPQSDTVKADTTKTVINLKKKVKKIKVVEGIVKLDSITLGANQSIRLKVLQVMMTDSVKPFSKSVNFPVYSSKNKVSDPYLRFPIEVGGMYSSYKFADRQLAGYQYDVRGSGDLDFAKNHYLSFIVHGPNQFSLAAAGSYDQYNLEYSYQKRLKLTLGDYNLRVSNLLEFSRLGRGIKYEQYFKKTNFSIFYLKPRFFPYQRDTYGATFTIKPSNKFNVSFNYLSKILLDNSLKETSANFLGISTNYVVRRFTLENEVAHSSNDDKQDFAIFNRFAWSIGRLAINNNIIYSGKNFTGSYRDSYLLINNLNYSLSKKTNFYVSSNISRLNPSLDQTIFTTSPFSQNNSIGFNYQINKPSRVFISYENREREDRSFLKSFHFAEQYGRIMFLVTKPKFGIYLDNRIGVSQNLLIKVDSSVNRRLIQNTIQPQFKVFSWLWLDTFFNYQRTSSFANDNKLQNLFFYGAGAKMTISDKFNANVIYRNNYTPDELVEKRTFLDINANLKLGNHQFTFSGGKSFIPIIDGSNQNIEYYSLKYTLKLNAPIARNKKLSSIKGQIIGLSNTINPKGIIVQMGDRRFMADANGNFQFNDLMPNRYFVNVVRSSMGSGIVTATKSPIEVNVKADTSYKIEISITKTGSILGKINFQKSENVGAIDITKQKPKVLVKLFNENESFLTQVNDKDEFSFKEIKPGKWKVIASILGNSEMYSILNPEIIVDLESEKVKDILISITTKERKVYFSNKTHQLNNKSKK